MPLKLKKSRNPFALVHRLTFDTGQPRNTSIFTIREKPPDIERFIYLVELTPVCRLTKYHPIN